MGKVPGGIMKIAFVAVLVMFCLWGNVGLAASKALVIGNDDYPGHALQNARNDASSIAAKLQSIGYKTTLRLDLKLGPMNEAINGFAHSLEAGDTAVFYYAGHGFQLNGENYLVPTDFVAGDPEQARERGYPLYSLLKNFTEHGAMTQIIILDACRDNPFLSTRSIVKGWSALSTSAGTFLAFGTSPGSTANDDPTENHGLFTKFVLKHMDDSSSDIERLFKDVRRDVINAAKGSQVPWTESSLIGTISLGRAGVGTVKAATTKEAPEIEVPSLESARSLSSRSDFAPKRIGMSFDADVLSPEIATLIQSAHEEMRLGRIDDSISTLKRGLSLFPTCLTILKMLGIALGIAGRDVEADNTLDRALALEPRDAMVRVYKCIVLTANSAEMAQDACNEAVTSDPGSGSAHLAIAELLLSNGQSIRALAEATTALDIEPKNPVAFALRGRIFMNMGEQESAKSDFEEAAKLALLEQWNGAFRLHNP